MHWVVVVLLLASLAGAWNWWTSERHVRVPPGIVAPAAPAQKLLDPPPTFVAKEHEFIARARYDVTARVLRKEIYRIDGGANLAPVDLVYRLGRDVGYCRRRRARVLADGPVPVLEAEGPDVVPADAGANNRQAAQVHPIPADAAIERRLRARPGQVVRLSGYLVDIRGPGGFRWRTSLSREDTGDGACEIMWIESLVVD